VAGGGSVWVSSRQSATVRRIDVRTGRIVATIQVGTDPESIALGYGSVWVVNGKGGYVSRINPRTNRVIAQIAVGDDERPPADSPCCHGIAAGYGAVWVAVHKDHKLVRIDPATNRATSQLAIVLPNITDLSVRDVMVGDGSIWVHAEPHLLFRIDPTVMASA
jgi:DNA-binding beta-propeller fold protein YncE